MGEREWEAGGEDGGERVKWGGGEEGLVGLWSVVKKGGGD